MLQVILFIFESIFISLNNSYHLSWIWLFFGCLNENFNYVKSVILRIQPGRIFFSNYKRSSMQTSRRPTPMITSVWVLQVQWPSYSNHNNNTQYTTTIIPTCRLSSHPMYVPVFLNKMAVGGLLATYIGPVGEMSLCRLILIFSSPIFFSKLNLSRARFHPR